MALDGISPENWPTRDDLTSDAFARLRAGLTERIEHLRETNDSQLLDELKTARIRGQIAECKELLAMVTPPSPANEANRAQPFAPRPTRAKPWTDLT